MLILGPRRPLITRPKIVSASLESETTAWVNAVVADGGSVSGTQQTNVNTLISSLKSNSAWTALKRLWLYAGESDASQAKIDLVALSSHTLIGAPNLNASGYAGNGSTTGIDTNYNPSADSMDGTTAIVCSYITGNDTGDNAVFGQTAGGSYTYLRITNSGADAEFGLADASFNTTTGDGGGTMVGLWSVYATGAANVSLAKNGSNIESDTRGVNSFESVTFMVGGYNLSGALTDPSTCRTGIFLIGTDSTKRTVIETALNAYMTAWGINAY